MAELQLIKVGLFSKERSTQRWISKGFATQRFQTFVYSDWAKASLAIKNEKFELFIVDMDASQGSWIQYFKDIDEGLHLHFILISSCFSSEELDLIKSQSNIDCLQKDSKKAYREIIPVLAERAFQTRVLRDELQRMETSHYFSEIKHRLLLNSIKSPILALKRDYEILYFNDAFLKFMKLSRLEAEGKQFKQFSADLIPEGLLPLIQEANSVSETVEKEMIWKGKNLYTVATQTPWGVLIVFDDITHRKNIEEALIDSESRFRRMAENIQDGLTIIEQGKVAYVNDRICDILGCSKADILAKSEDELSGSEAFFFLARRKNRDDLSSKEVWIVRSDGKRRCILNRYSTSYVGGDPVGIYVVSTDITDRKITEEKARESAQRIKTLLEVSRRFPACESEMEIYTATIDAVSQIFRKSKVHLSILNGKELVTKAVSPEIDQKMIMRMNMEPGLSWRTFSEQKTQIIKDLRGEFEEFSGSKDLYSAISVPVGNLGVFQIFSSKMAFFSDEDGRLLELLLGHTQEALKRIRLQNELEKRAHRDPLTGVFNRYYLSHVLNREIRRAQRYNRHIGFMMMDVDKLKWINDRHGHQIGDQVLKAVAKILSNQLRETDIVVRYGGDEFLIVLLETGIEIHEIKKRILTEVIRLNESKELFEFPISISIGTGHWIPNSGESIQDVLKRADQQMYEEKRQHNWFFKPVLNMQGQATN